jgi:hypothetical protein
VRLAQLPDTLPYVLDRLAIRRFFPESSVVVQDNLRLRRLNQTVHIRWQAQAPAAIPHASAILHKAASFATDHLAV